MIGVHKNGVRIHMIGVRMIGDRSLVVRKIFVCTLGFPILV